MLGRAVLFCTLILFHLRADPPSLLIEIAATGSADRLICVLDSYYHNLSQEIPVSVILISDWDDQSLNSSDLKPRLATYPRLTVLSSRGKTKPEIFNQGIKDLEDKFDILVVASDELEPAVKGYDKLIVESFTSNFPDGEGVLNTLSFGNESINRAPVMGKPYYQRFGYVYNPLYHTSFYGEELTLVSRILGKEAIETQSIWKRVAPQVENKGALSLADANTFQKQRRNHFDVDEATLQKLFPKEWSILICTLDERAAPFSYLYNKLQGQIKDKHLEDKVEILFFKDNRENTVGFKRNALLRQSRGRYVNFIDDDDDVHDNYVAMIHEKLSSKPDCVSLIGIITFNDQNPKQFIHSVKFKAYFEKDNVYYRPPNHLNTMQRATAAQFLFPAISFGEDTDWAMRLCRAGLLQKEEEIKEPYYFYKYVSK